MDGVVWTGQPARGSQGRPPQPIMFASPCQEGKGLLAQCSLGPRVGCRLSEGTPGTTSSLVLPWSLMTKFCLETKENSSTATVFRAPI